MTTEERRAWALGYLWCLRVLRALKKERGLSWEQAVTAAGKWLVPLLRDASGLPYAESERVCPVCQGAVKIAGASGL